MPSISSQNSSPVIPCTIQTPSKKLFISSEGSKSHTVLLLSTSHPPIWKHCTRSLNVVLKNGLEIVCSSIRFKISFPSFIWNFWHFSHLNKKNKWRYMTLNIRWLSGWDTQLRCSSELVQVPSGFDSKQRIKSHSLKWLFRSLGVLFLIKISDSFQWSLVWRHRYISTKLQVYYFPVLWNISVFQYFSFSAITSVYK